jgi:hypothetical protein
VTAVLKAEDGTRLASFREVARQVRDASIIAGAEEIQVAARTGPPGYVDVYVRLLQDEPFRSLAVAIRLAYLQGEPAHFYAVCNVLHRISGPQLQARVRSVRAGYRDALSGSGLSIGDGQEPDSYTAAEVLDTWLHGLVFHQDPVRQRDATRLLSAGPGFPWSVQRVALLLAGRILDLDDVIAERLSAPQLPRIMPGK